MNNRILMIFVALFTGSCLAMEQAGDKRVAAGVPSFPEAIKRQRSEGASDESSHSHDVADYKEIVDQLLKLPSEDAQLQLLIKKIGKNELPKHLPELLFLLFTKRLGSIARAEAEQAKLTELKRELAKNRGAKTAAKQVQMREQIAKEYERLEAASQKLIEKGDDDE